MHLIVHPILAWTSNPANSCCNWFCKNPLYTYQTFPNAELKSAPKCYASQTTRHKDVSQLLE
jgi:hypothetical protein